MILQPHSWVVTLLSYWLKHHTLTLIWKQYATFCLFPVQHCHIFIVETHWSSPWTMSQPSSWSKACTSWKTRQGNVSWQCLGTPAIFVQHSIAYRSLETKQSTLVQLHRSHRKIWHVWMRMKDVTTLTTLTMPILHMMEIPIEENVQTAVWYTENP